MHMLSTIYRLYIKANTRLGSAAFYPIPAFVRTYLRRFPFYLQLVKYARLVNGVDMSVIAPDEYGCVESITRMMRNLDENIVPVMTYTPYFARHMDKSDRFIEVSERMARNIGRGVIVVAITQPNVWVGHVGVLDGDRIWSNDSYKGVWNNKFTLLRFKEYYKRLEIKYYIAI